MTSLKLILKDIKNNNDKILENDDLFLHKTDFSWLAIVTHIHSVFSINLTHI